MELVTLLDEQGNYAGTLPKHEVHTADTPLHLAFSCYLFSDDDHLLVTRRALTKQTWPGVWTNSFCGHPLPQEQMHEAIARRAAQELGTQVRDIRIAIPDFRYRAVDASGVVENEICPVYTATIDEDLAPAREEVAEWAWTTLDAAVAAVESAPYAFSPWMREQSAQLLMVREG